MNAMRKRCGVLILSGALASTALQAQFYNVVSYGAAGNGSTDDTTAINNARAAAEGAGGGTVFFPAGTYCVSSTITNGNGTSSGSSSIKAVLFAGPVPSGEDTAAATIRWCGSSPGSASAIIRFLGPIEGGGIRDLLLDAANVSNVYGLQLIQQTSGKFDGLGIRRVAGREAIQLTAHYSTAPFACDNTFTRLSIRSPGTGGSGMLFDGNLSGSSGDSCSNTVVGAKIFHDGTTSGTHGIKLRFADNNTFIRTNLYATPTEDTPSSSTCGVRFEQYSNATNFPQENTFYELSAHSGVCGSTGTLAPNKFIGFNFSDCKVNCGPNWRAAGTITAGSAPVVYTTDGKLLLVNQEASPAYLSALDGSGTVLFSLKRGGPSTNGLQITSFDEVVMNNSGGLGVSTLRAATSNQMCYNTSVLSGYNALATCSSLSTFKENIVPLKDATGLALRLNAVTYDSTTSNRPEIGLIAEEVAEIEPRLATYDGDGRLVGVDYGHTAAVALQAIRELHKRIQALESRAKKRNK